MDMVYVVMLEGGWVYEGGDSYMVAVFRKEDSAKELAERANELLKKGDFKELALLDERHKHPLFDYAEYFVEEMQVRE